MYRLALLTGITMMSFSTLALAASPPAAAEGQLVQLEQRAAKAAKSTAGEYAQPLLDAAKTSIADAKISIAAGKEKIAARNIELADIQLNAADVKGAEKELQEKVAIRRSELKKMEARLERFRQGEEN
jgi:apolipoprotein N-acyltransferase